MEIDDPSNLLLFDIAIFVKWTELWANKTEPRVQRKKKKLDRKSKLLSILEIVLSHESWLCV